jgi:hypothetical protein
MDKKHMMSKIAFLESKLDMLETEFDYINKILTKCGFPEGIKTLKEAAYEILSEKKEKRPI